MSLQAGARLGPYEIVAALGTGGMGEVYRARDTKLNREVAIKVLPGAVATDPDRLARFHREAQVLASLNHPNIAAIYGFEDSNAVHALVMELVEGPTLADRILQGAVPLNEALAIAKQIAEALAAAHEQGIIHRDLKPANVKVREDGTVKVLDFGLAKMLEAGEGGLPGRLDATASPTMTSPAMMTSVGMILGTAAYMAPEQARGRPVDKRADIWAFGVVLYEMLTGRRLFDGDEVSDTLAAVLKTEPDWTALPAAVPPAIRVLLKRCLAKDRTKRIGDIAAALFIVDEIAALPATAGPQNVAEVRRLWPRVAAVGTGTLILGAAIAGSAVWLARPPVTSRVTRTLLTSAGPGALSINGTLPDLTITPDGTRVVYVGGNGSQLFVRALDALTPVVIATGRFRAPFVSPDGQWVGVEDGVLLKRVPITGGPLLPIVRLDGGSRGASWASDHTIIFSDSRSLQRVSDTGGMPEALTHGDVEGGGVIGKMWPEVLPEGRAVLFTNSQGAAGSDASQLAVLDLRTGTQRVVLRGASHGHYVGSGHLIYTAAGALFAVPFDLSRLETRGVPVPVVPAVGGAGDFAVATDGTLVYADARGGAVVRRTLVWVDRTGKEVPIAAPPRAYAQVRMSPDGTRVAAYSDDEEGDIWIWDLRQSKLSRLTFDPGQDMYPVWSPDGRTIVFGSQRGGRAYNLWRQAADGTGVAERLTTSDHTNGPHSITPDGASVIFEEIVPDMGRDLMRMSLDATRRITPLVRTKFQEVDGVVSPNGRWLAYQTDITGRAEIHVRPYPNADSGHWQVSFDGGREPLWAQNGKELFYRAADGGVTRVEVDSASTTWSAGEPAKLFAGPYFVYGFFWGYDVSPDGQRFLMIKDTDAKSANAPPSIIVVQHWDDELKRLVPTK